MRYTININRRSCRNG